MLDSLPMRSVRGLGGKFGERVERVVVEHGGVSDAARTAASGAGRGSSSTTGRIPRVGVGSSPVGRFPTRVRRENGGLARARLRRRGHRTGRAERSGRREESVRVQIIRRRHGQTARASMASACSRANSPRDSSRIDCDRDARRNYSDWSTAPNSKRHTCETGKQDAWDN